MPAPHEQMFDNITSEFILAELNKIIQLVNSVQCKQDAVLLDFIKYSYITLGQNQSDKTKWYANFRSFVFHLHQFAKQIPSRSTQGFWSYFVNKKSRGELYDAVCILHNKVVKSEIYQHSNNVDKLIELAAETGYLNLSCCVLRQQHIDKISTLNNLKTLVISHISVMVDGKILPLFKVSANSIIQCINHLVGLEALDLSENDFSLLSHEGLRGLISSIKNLHNLSSFLLKNCRINDFLLIELFKINKRGNILSNIETLPRLRYLDLSCNNIRFYDYHQEGDDKSEFDKTVCQEQFLRELSVRNVEVDLTFNHICTYSTKKRIHTTSPIFDHFNNVMKADQRAEQIFKVESIINSNYLIDRYNSLAVIADDIIAEHALILVESIDENDQHQIMMYHLKKKRDNYFGVKVEIKTYKDGDYNDFITVNNNMYRYGKFYIIDTEKLDRLVKRISSDKKGINQSLYQLHFSCCDTAINCFRYCLIIFKCCIDPGITDPWLAIPRFYLNNITPTPSVHGRYYFEIPTSGVLSSANNVNPDKKTVFDNVNKPIFDKLAKISAQDNASNNIESIDTLSHTERRSNSI